MNLLQFGQMNSHEEEEEQGGERRRSGISTNFVVDKIQLKNSIKSVSTKLH